MMWYGFAVLWDVYGMGDGLSASVFDINWQC